MSGRDAFGPNLRRRRVRAGLSLEQIADDTRVSIDLLDGLERNDFSRWPSGVQARAFVRGYAAAIGVDPDETVNEFCRGFPQGDRRAERVVRNTAEFLGHRLDWQDDLPAEGDRRAPAGPPPATADTRMRTVQRVRLLAGAMDAAVVIGASVAIAQLLRVGVAIPLAAIAVVYNLVAVGLLGASPAVWAVDTYLTSHPDVLRLGPLRMFRRLDNRPAQPEDVALANQDGNAAARS